MRNKTRFLPRQIKVWKNRKEEVLELQKSARVLAYNLEIRNLLLKI